MSISRQDRIKGTLLGQAAGDALGSHYEFGPPSNGNATMGRGTFGHEPGEWTDDTQLATCIAAAHSDIAMTAINIVNWFNGNPKDVGISTAKVIGLAREPHMLQAASRSMGEYVVRQPRPAGWDPGMANGSLMRTGPACLPFLGDRDKIAQVARTLSDLTHYDPEGWTGDACVIWSLAIDSAIARGESFRLDTALTAAVAHLPAERVPFWQAVVRNALYGLGTPKRNGSAVSAFKCALSAVAHAEDSADGILADGLQRAVAMGDDTDTVAAIAGALLGAIHGASAVPQQWRKALHGWSPRGELDAAGLEDLVLEAAEKWS